jgi:glycosyltransferase involved in cell wall biosynthesis
MPRILIAAAHRSVVGGVETYLRALLPALTERGHDVALLHEELGEPGQAVIDDHVPALPRWHFADVAVLRAAADWRPDVCFAHGLSEPQREEALLEHFPAVLFAHNYHGTCISGSKCHAFPHIQPCRRTLGPLCLALHYARRCGGLNPHTTLRQYRLQRGRRGLLPRYRAVVVASAHMREEIVRHGVPAERVQLVPLFPPGVVPDPVPPAAQPWTHRVLFVGRLTELKGGAYLVPAVAEAGRALGRRLQLVVAGDGPQRPALERLARRSGVFAEFCGWVDGPRRTALMRGADLLAVPSVWPEPFGLVGLEAACVGLPAVAFAVGGVRDWLRPGVSGELAPGDPPTVHGLAAAIARALIDTQRHARLRHGAWTIAHAFGREQHVDRLEHLFERMGAADVQGNCPPAGAAVAVEPPAHLEDAALGGAIRSVHDRA